MEANWEDICQGKEVSLFEIHIVCGKIRNQLIQRNGLRKQSLFQSDD